MADAAAGVRSDSDVQRAGNVTFVLRDGVWTDVRYKNSGPVLRESLTALLAASRAATGTEESAITAAQQTAPRIIRFNMQLKLQVSPTILTNLPPGIQCAQL